MNNFDNKYFAKFDFTAEQIAANLNNARKDLDIAERDKILDVKFNYSYTALLKAGLAVLSQHKVKVRSLPGHHIRIIEALADILKDQTIIDVGEAMRRKRNLGLYAGGIDVTAKECAEYLGFTRKILARVNELVK